jgi:hypothetical protein
MESVADGAKAKVREWTDKHKHAVLYDEPQSTFLDVASGKRVKIAWRDLTTWEEKLHPETNDAYIVLLFEDGRQLALVDPVGLPLGLRRKTPARCKISRRWFASEIFSRLRTASIITSTITPTVPRRGNASTSS